MISNTFYGTSYTTCTQATVDTGYSNKHLRFKNSYIRHDLKNLVLLKYITERNICYNDNIESVSLDSDGYYPTIDRIWRV